MSFVWNMPTKVLFGADRLNDLEYESMPGKKAMLLISDGNSAQNNGGLERVESILRKNGTEYLIFDKISSNPLESQLMEGVALARESGVDFVIGLGGGCVIDSAKVMASVIPQDTGDIWDYMTAGTGGGNKLKKKSLPVIAIPTTSGSGSEVNRFGAVTKADTNEKLIFTADFPTLSIVDPSLMLTVSPELTAQTGFNALLRSLESYIAGTRGECSQMVELAAIGNIAQYLPIALQNPEDIDARSKLAYASMMSGLSTAFSGFTSEQAIANAMSAHHGDLSNGAGLVILSEEYFRYFIEKKACDDRFLEMALAMGQINIREAMDFLRALKRVKGDCDVDNIKMSDYGITQEELPIFAKEALVNMPEAFQNDMIPLPEENIVEILEGSYM